MSLAQQRSGRDEAAQTIQSHFRGHRARATVAPARALHLGRPVPEVGQAGSIPRVKLCLAIGLPPTDPAVEVPYRVSLSRPSSRQAEPLATGAKGATHHASRQTAAMHVGDTAHVLATLHCEELKDVYAEAMTAEAVRGMRRATRLERLKHEQDHRLDAREAAYRQAAKAARAERRRAAKQAAPQGPATPRSYARGAALPSLSSTAASTSMQALAATVASASATVASMPSAMVKETLHSRLIAAALMAMPPLKRRPLLELRSYLKPPPLIVRVMECVCILLHTEPTWESAKLELADASFFLERVGGFGRNGAQPMEEAVAWASKYVDDPAFTPEEVSKVASSPAATWLCRWCREVVGAFREADRRSVLWMPKDTRTALGVTTPASSVVAKQLTDNAAALGAIVVPEWGSDGGMAVPEWGSTDFAKVSASNTLPPSRHAKSARGVAMMPHPPPGGKAPWHTARPDIGNMRRRPPPPRALQPLLKLTRGMPRRGGEETPRAPGQEGDVDWREAARMAARGGDKKTQTKANLEALAEKQALALQAMLSKLGDAGGSASEALALARRAAAPPPSATVERVKVSRRAVFNLKRGALIDGSTSTLRPRGATAALGSLWEDGGLRTAARKKERAELSEWRAKRVAWRRASGLRRQLVIALAQREQRHETRLLEETTAQTQRKLLWRAEDDAACLIQDVWREWQIKRRHMTSQARQQASKEPTADSEPRDLVTTSQDRAAQEEAALPDPDLVGVAAINDTVEKTLGPLLQQLQDKMRALGDAHLHF